MTLRLRPPTVHHDGWLRGELRVLSDLVQKAHDAPAAIDLDELAIAQQPRCVLYVDNSRDRILSRDDGSMTECSAYLRDDRARDGEQRRPRRRRHRHDKHVAGTMYAGGSSLRQCASSSLRPAAVSCRLSVLLLSTSITSGVRRKKTSVGSARVPCDTNRRPTASSSRAGACASR